MSGIYSCCGAPADGSSGTGCSHGDGHVVTERRWRQLSHGAVGPHRPAWRKRGSLCASGCDCAERAREVRP